MIHPINRLTIFSVDNENLIINLIVFYVTESNYEHN